MGLIFKFQKSSKIWNL